MHAALLWELDLGAGTFDSISVGAALIAQSADRL